MMILLVIQARDHEPHVIWLSGLHVPESYLTALVQATCRKNGWPLDKSTLYTSVTTYTEPEDVTERVHQGNTLIVVVVVVGGGGGASSSSSSYGMSPALYDHTVLPTTRHKWTQSALTPAHRRVLNLPTPEGWKAELTYATRQWQLAISRSQVRRPNDYTPELPFLHVLPYPSFCIWFLSFPSFIHTVYMPLAVHQPFMIRNDRLCVECH